MNDTFLLHMDILTRDTDMGFRSVYLSVCPIASNVNFKIHLVGPSFYFLNTNGVTQFQR